MLSLSALPKELEFLSDILGERKLQYRTSDFLRSSFEEMQWICVFGKSPRITIDFRVRLSDGSSLTDMRHRKLLEVIKCWICVQTHFDATGGRRLFPAVAYDRVCRTLRLADYFLLREGQFDLVAHGFATLTENDVTGLLVCLAESKYVAFSIYQWPARVSAFLRSRISQCDPSRLQAAIAARPTLAEDIPDRADRMLDLDDGEVVLARAWLWVNGFYSRTTGRSTPYRFGPNGVRLQDAVLGQSLWQHQKHPTPLELRIEPYERLIREYQPVAINSRLDQRASDKDLPMYAAAMRRMGLLEEVQLNVPTDALKALDNAAVKAALNLKSVGRFRSLPQSAVLGPLRKAIEFSLELGDDIVDSVVSVFRLAKEKGVDVHALTDEEIVGALTPKLRQVGVKTWSLQNKMTLVERNPNTSGAAIGAADYFRRFRANEGLYDLIRALYGSDALTVGVLTARRSSELRELVAGKCLDRSGTHLIFRNRKSGEAGAREIEARPIPALVTRIFKRIERFQGLLVDIGVLNHLTNVFAFPDRDECALAGASHVRYNIALDAFCDFAETPLNDRGQRYYLRQHQLRRFFVMLFFWGGAFGGMETLRWFLGHTDIEHLYRYITESVPGAVLRLAKANFAITQVKSGAVAAEGLAELLDEHFGTRNFSALDSDELDEYVEELIVAGAVEIEPEFFSTPQGKDYRVLIKVTPKASLT